MLESELPRVGLDRTALRHPLIQINPITSRDATTSLTMRARFITPSPATEGRSVERIRISGGPRRFLHSPAYAVRWMQLLGAS